MQSFFRMFLLYQILANSIRVFINLWGLVSSKTRVYFKHRTLYKKEGYSLPTLWFHASSYGEFEGILPIITEAKQEGSAFILCSFFSSSGYIPLKDHPQVDQAVYAPFDTKKDVNHFLNEFRPAKLIISQNDFWPQMIQSCLDRQIPIYFVGTYLRTNHWWLKRSTLQLTAMLKEVSAIYVQDELSYDLLSTAGFKNIELTGNPRVDQVIKNAEDKKSYPILEEFSKRKPLLVCGSTLAKDEAIILAAIDDTVQMNVLLVPHDPSSFNYGQLSHFSWVRYSEIDTKRVPDTRIIVMDTLGDLKYVYGYGHMAYVGGGFDAGVHSVLEPAIFKIPLLSGPNTSKFRSAKDLKELNCLTIINNKKELKLAMTATLYRDNRDISADLTSYINSNKGASKQIYDSIRLSKDVS